MPKRSKTIPEGDWIITIALDMQGERVDCGELRYTDAFVAKNNAETGRLIAGRLDELARRFAP